MRYKEKSCQPLLLKNTINFVPSRKKETKQIKHVLKLKENLFRPGSYELDLPSNNDLVIMNLACQIACMWLNTEIIYISFDKICIINTFIVIDITPTQIG